MFVSGLALFCERRFHLANGAPFGPQQVGYLWAFAGFLGIFLQGPGLGRLVKRFGESALNRIGFLGYVAGYLALAYCFSVPQLIVATVICSIGGVVRPTLTSLITQAAPREEQGVVLGLAQSITSLGQIFGPLLAGFFIQHGWLSGWGVLTAAVAGIGLVLSASQNGTPAKVQPI